MKADVVGCSASYRYLTDSVTGTLTFNSDLTYSLALEYQLTYDAHLPPDCTPTYSSCSDVQDSFNMDKAAGVSALCSAVPGACDCVLTESPFFNDEAGTYSISGTTVMMNGGSIMSLADYCVDGTTLHWIITSTTRANPSGPTVIYYDTVAQKL